jgi:RNAse (barnase) inhibitor barstar
MTTAFDQFLASEAGRPYIHLLSLEEELLDEWMERLQAATDARRPDAVIRLLHGERCPTSAGFFAEMARALEFPDHFGHNWAALTDCLTDMGWLPASAYLLVMRHAEELFSASSEQAWHVLGELLNEEIADETVPLRLILVTDQAMAMAERLIGAGVPFGWVSAG